MMDQVNISANQQTVPSALIVGPVAAVTETADLSGFPAPLGVNFATAQIRPSSLYNAASQPAMGQPDRQSATILIPGRITGPVRLIQKVAHAWRLSNAELALLLAYPSPGFAKDLLAGKLTFSGNEDRADRVRLIYFTHATLSDLFVDEGDEARWIRTATVMLDNDTPLNVMLSRRIPGMLAVREIVERYLARR